MVVVEEVNRGRSEEEVVGRRWMILLMVEVVEYVAAAAAAKGACGEHTDRLLLDHPPVETQSQDRKKQEARRRALLLWVLVLVGLTMKLAEKSWRLHYLREIWTIEQQPVARKRRSPPSCACSRRWPCRL